MDIVSRIEHTNLQPTTGITDIERLIEEAHRHSFYGICVAPFWVKQAKREIANRAIALVTVVGFPLGFNLTETKLQEMTLALDNGADEIDFVWNMGAFKSGMNWTKIELAKASQIVHSRQKVLKVIIEAGLLTADEIVAACELCRDAGADLVKTSTGFAGQGAQVAHVALMRKVLPASVGIKASGRIRTRDQALQLIQAGADRIGTSAGMQIIAGG